MPHQHRDSVEFEDIQLEELNRPHTSAMHGQPDAGHRERLQEMIERPATPAPFPEELPERPTKRSSKAWIISTVVLLCLSVGFISSTAVLGARLNHTAQVIATPSPVTITEGPTPPATTVTQRKITTSTQVVVEICNNNRSGEDRFISAHYCVIVDCNNEAQADIWQNDCKNFCRDQDFCGSAPDAMSSRMKDCCSSCDCGAEDDEV